MTIVGSCNVSVHEGLDDNLTRVFYSLTGNDSVGCNVDDHMDTMGIIYYIISSMMFKLVEYTQRIMNMKKIPRKRRAMSNYRYPLVLNAL